MIDVPQYIKKDIKTLKISSEAFENKNYIPEKYTCDGLNINPPIAINNIPKKTKSLVVIVEDVDSPIRAWTHWIIWNISPTKKIKENSISGIEGLNDFSQYNYGGPCPHSGTHQYYFKVYALDDILYLNQHSTKNELERDMNSHIISSGVLIGLYKRKK